MNEPQAADDDSRPDELRRGLTDAVRHAQLEVQDLWLHYFSLGGTAGEYELDAYINASYSLPTLQHDILAQTVNEMIDQLPPPPRAPFSSSLGPSDHSGGPEE